LWQVSSQGDFRGLSQFFVLHAWKVFFNKAAIVIGPTPPGTGVIHEHLGATVS
jgi:hypothetical protein